MKALKKIKNFWKTYSVKCFFSRPTKILLRICYIFLFLYLLLYIFAARIEGYATFPGVFVNTLEYTDAGYIPPSLDFQDINISVSEKNINALYVDRKAEKTVYYFHGNGGDLTYFYTAIEFIASMGYNVLALEYPGYGKSEGFPFEADIMLAAEEVYNYGKKQYNITEQNTIVWGYSIGTGVATEFALGKNIDSLVLLASFTSRYDLSRTYYGFALQKIFFLTNSFITEENIKHISAPKFFMHGTADTLVPFIQGKKNFEAATGIKYFFEIPNGDHFDFFSLSDAQRDIKNFLQYHTTDLLEIEALNKKIFLESLDTLSDNSFQKYVDAQISFTDRAYTPEDMRKLDSTYIIDTKGDAQMRTQAADYFEQMAQKYYQDRGEKIAVVSSYRSYNYQLGIKARGCPDNLCAKAGYSEHQSGLSVDLWSASSDSYWKSSTSLMQKYTWLTENAHTYGFSNSYRNGIEIDSYDVEPWHWRYLGVELASYLKEKDITFAQYYYQNKK